MQIIIVGGRPDDPDFVDRSLSKLHSRRRITQISHGCSDPCALPAEAWAQARGVSTICYPANWDLYGRRAANYRDSAMLNADRADLLLAIGGGLRVARIKFHALLYGITVVTADLRDQMRSRPDVTPFTRRVLVALALRQSALEPVEALTNDSDPSRVPRS